MSRGGDTIKESRHALLVWAEAAAHLWLSARRAITKAHNDVVDCFIQEGETVCERPARYVISVMAQDHVGIIADVTAALYDLGGNLEALSQTIVHGWFTMILCAAFPAGVDKNAVKAAFESLSRCQVLVNEAFDAAPAPAVAGDPYVVTVIGEDRPGIVRRLTRCFAEKGINIEDVWNEVKENRFVVILSVVVPPDIDPKDLRYDLEQAADELDVSLRLQHQDVFTATNSLAMHTKR